MKDKSSSETTLIMIMRNSPGTAIKLKLINLISDNVTLYGPLSFVLTLYPWKIIWSNFLDHNFSNIEVIN